MRPQLNATHQNHNHPDKFTFRGHPGLTAPVACVFSGPLLVTRSRAPLVAPPAFLGELIFVGGWEICAVFVYLCSA